MGEKLDGDIFVFHRIRKFISRAKRGALSHNNTSPAQFLSLLVFVAPMLQGVLEVLLILFTYCFNDKETNEMCAVGMLRAGGAGDCHKVHPSWREKETKQCSDLWQKTRYKTLL